MKYLPTTTEAKAAPLLEFCVMFSKVISVKNIDIVGLIAKLWQLMEVKWKLRGFISYQCCLNRVTRDGILCQNKFLSDTEAHVHTKLVFLLQKPCETYGAN